MWINPHEHKLVGRVLAEARERAGLSQDALAEKLGKPQSFVSGYENGHRRVDVLELLRIAAALNADPKRVFARIADERSRVGNA